MNRSRICALFFLLMTAVSGSAETEPGDKHWADSITIASEPDYPPYCMVDKQGQPEGFSVDLFKAAADAVGLHVTIQVGLWENIKADLAQGKIDALPLVGRTPEREKLYDFTMPYLSLHGAVFAREGTGIVKSVEDLKDKTIVVMKGDNAEEFVRRHRISEHIVTTRTYEEAFRELADGKFDAVITQRVMGIELLKKMAIPSITPLSIQLPEFRQDFCFAVKEGDDRLLSRLNEGLSIVIANGTYERIKLKWLGPDIKERLSLKDVLMVVFYTVFPLLILGSVVSIVILQREVRRRTKSLHDEVSGHRKTLAMLAEQEVLIRENERQIRLLLNSTAEGIYGIDTEGNCTFVNQSALKILGYEEPGIIGKNMHDLIHHTGPGGDKISRDECLIFRAYREGLGYHSDSEVFWRSDGTSFPVEYFSYPIVQDGQVTGAVVTFLDIHERKKAENELIRLKNDLEIEVAKRTRELQEKIQKLDKSQKAMLYMVEDLNRITSELKKERRSLELSNQELEAFAYSVSHDLRAPLRAIDGFSRFLLEDYGDRLDDEGRRFIHTIRANTAGMDRLISDLLSLSRISRVEMNPVPTDMTDMAVSMFHETATDEEKKSFDFSVAPLQTVSCDISLMKQVWKNLIGNALKYSSRSSIRNISIRCDLTETEVVFCVEDRGAGFDERYKDRMFGVFQRLHKDEEFEGSGVGLAIVHRIVQRHGGRVWAEGGIGEGARIFFSLPRV